MGRGLPIVREVQDSRAETSVMNKKQEEGRGVTRGCMCIILV
jgi:hypothetical protein